MHRTGAERRFARVRHRLIARWEVRCIVRRRRAHSRGAGGWLALTLTPPTPSVDPLPVLQLRPLDILRPIHLARRLRMGPKRRRSLPRSVLSRAQCAQTTLPGRLSRGLKLDTPSTTTTLSPTQQTLTTPHTANSTRVSCSSLSPQPPPLQYHTRSNEMQYETIKYNAGLVQLALKLAFLSK